MAITFCPECDYNISLKKPKLGQRVVCQNCRVQLRVVNLRPIELDWGEEEVVDEEDWGTGKKKRNSQKQASRSLRKQSARYFEEEYED